MWVLTATQKPMCVSVYEGGVKELTFSKDNGTVMGAASSPGGYFTGTV